MINVAEKSSVSHETTVKALPMLVTEPAALGLFGLAVAALLLASVDLGLTSSTAKALMIPWIFFFGCVSQLIAGIMEFKRQNIFGATVFTSFAMVMSVITFTLIIAIFGGVEVDFAHYGYGLIAVLGIVLIATVASLMTNKTLFIILIFVNIAVIDLIAHYLLGASAFIAGVFLLLTSLGAFYAAAAILINTMAQKVILPLGKPLWNP